MTLTPALAGDRGGDLGDLEGVGQPGALVVGRVDHDLGLAGQPAEGGGVHDPVAVALEAGALVVGLLGYGPVPGARGEGRARPQLLPLPLLAYLAVDQPARADGGSGAGVRPDEVARRR